MDYRFRGVVHHAAGATAVVCGSFLLGTEPGLAKRNRDLEYRNDRRASRRCFNPERYRKKVLPGLALLSTCFAINHIGALMTAPGNVSHLLGAFGNIVGVLLYVAYLFTQKRDRR